MSSFPKPEISQHRSPHSSTDHFLFSILLPSWNNLDYLKLCVQSIEKNSTFKHQVIIHVNEGTDGTLEWVKSKGFDYTYSARNSGVCYAVNAAAQLRHLSLKPHGKSDCFDQLLF